MTNDSAPLHIARLHNIPAIVYSGQGHVSRFIGDDKFMLTKLDCANCNWRCPYDKIGNSYPCVKKLSRKEYFYEFREIFRRTYRSIQRIKN